MVTEQLVHEVCDEINARGERATYDRVRDAIKARGETGGSYSDLKDFIQSWRPSPRSGSSAAAGQAPEQLHQRSQNWVNDIWRLANTEAERRANERLAQITEDLQKAEDGLVELAAIADQAVAARENDRSELAASLQATAKLEIALHAAMTEIKVLRSLIRLQTKPTARKKPERRRVAKKPESKTSPQAAADVSG